MNHFFESIENSFKLDNHIGTSVLLVLFAKVSNSMAVILSVLSTTYSYTFSVLSIISVSLVVLCHWRKGLSEAKIMKLVIEDKIRKLRKKFSKKDK